MAVNVVVVAPAPAATDVGMIKAFVLLVDRATDAPPLGTALANVTVQVVPAPATTLDGEHCNPEIAGRMVIPPEPGSIEIAVPSDAAPITLLTPINAVPLLPGARVAVTTATTPLPIVLAFIPVARQLTDPSPPLQFILFPAAVSTGPADNTSEPIALVG